MTFDWRNAENWFVNLDSRPDRRASAEAQFAKHGLAARRFAGFTPDEWTGSEPAVARMRARTPGAIGCMQAQMNVIRTVQDSSRIVGVFEDDVIFCEDLTPRLDYIQQRLTWDWDVFYLGGTFHVPGVWCKHADCEPWGPEIGVDMCGTDDPRIMQVFGMWGTYSYFVNGRNARKVLDALEGIMPDSDGIDHAFIRLGDWLNCYCFVPGCAKQFDGQSNIGTGVTHFSHFASLGPYWFQERMEDFDPATFDWVNGQ